MKYDENERRWLYVTPDVRLAYSCLLAYVRRCLLILNHSFDTDGECAFANDTDLNKIVHQWVNLDPLEKDIPTNQSTGSVCKTIDVLRETFCSKRCLHYQAKMQLITRERIVNALKSSIICIVRTALPLIDKIEEVGTYLL